MMPQFFYDQPERPVYEVKKLFYKDEQGRGFINTFVFFNSKEIADQYSHYICATYGIKGASYKGAPPAAKYVAKHVRGDNRYCVVLTPDNERALSNEHCVGVVGSVEKSMSVGRLSLQMN